MQAKITITPQVFAVVRKADGRIIDLGNVSRPSLSTRWKLFKMRLCARKEV